MSTFAEDIVEAFGGQPPEQVVIGEEGWGMGLWLKDDEDDPRKVPDAMKGTVLLWQQAQPLLDYEYDTGFGSADCHNIYAWGRGKVGFVSEYDGATMVMTVPRSPWSDGAEHPTMAGG